MEILRGPLPDGRRSGGDGGLGSRLDQAHASTTDYIWDTLHGNSKERRVLASFYVKLPKCVFQKHASTLDFAMGIKGARRRLKNIFLFWTLVHLRQDPPPLEAILVIFGRRALIFFCLKALGKKWKLTPLLCACAVVITLETQKCRKRAPRSVEFNFFINCDRHKRFSQNERRGVDLQNVASDFLIFA